MTTIMWAQNQWGQSQINLLPLGSTVVILGHSKVDASSSKGRRNFSLTAMNQLNARLRFNSGGYNQGKSGDTAAQILARVNNTVAQKPDIVIIQADHNSLDLGSASVISTNDAIDSAIATGSPNTLRIWMTETPSNVYPLGDPTLDAVNADIIAKASGNRVAVDSATGFVYSSMTWDNAHPNWAGALYEGGILQAFLDSRVEPQTVVEALSDTGVNNEHGANVDPLHAAFSTSVGNGTKLGTGSGLITGTVPDYCSLTNNTTAAVNIVGIDTYNGLGRITLDITGSSVSENYIALSRLNTTGGRCPINLPVGGLAESLVGVSLTHTDGVSAPLGLTFATLYSGVNDSMGNYASGDDKLGSLSVPLIDRVERTTPGVIGGMRQTALNNTTPQYGIRVAGTVNVRLVLYGFICRLTDLVATVAPFYVGDDGNHSTAFQAGQASGASTIAVGASVRFQPGDWTGGGISFTAILERSTDGGTNWTSVTTLTPSWANWTATGTAGDLIRLTVTGTNSLGSTAKQVIFTLT